MRGSWRVIAVVLILAIQLGAIAYARTTDSRYVAWAPYDRISLYQVEVEVNGSRLPADAVVERYPMGLWVDDDGNAAGRDNRSMTHVLHIVERWEEQNGDGVRIVRVTWRSNGGSEEVWQWTSP